MKNTFNNYFFRSLGRFVKNYRANAEPWEIDKAFKENLKRFHSYGVEKETVYVGMFALAIYCKDKYRNFQNSGVNRRFSHLLELDNFERIVNNLIEKDDSVIVILWVVYRNIGRNVEKSGRYKNLEDKMQAKVNEILNRRKIDKKQKKPQKFVSFL